MSERSEPARVAGALDVIRRGMRATPTLRRGALATVAEGVRIAPGVRVSTCGTVTEIRQFLEQAGNQNGR